MRAAAFSNRDWVLLAFAAAILGIGISASLEWWGITYVRNSIAGFQRSDVALAEAADSMRENVLQLRRYEKDVFINLASAHARDKYRAQWDAAFLNVRFDLTRVRSLAPQSMQGEVQKFVEAIAAYRSAFTRTYELIDAGSVVTTQQANDQMAQAKVAAHQAEQQLIEIGRQTQLRMADLSEPISFGRWICLALNLILLAVVAVPLVYAMRRNASPQAA
jgi:methyl-accepting chemotaxis protein